MSLRRLATVSPLIGCFSNAAPEAVQSLTVPLSKSRFNGRPSLPTGRVPGSVAARVAAEINSADDVSANSSQLLLSCDSRRGEEVIENLGGLTKDPPSFDFGATSEEDEEEETENGFGKRESVFTISLISIWRRSFSCAGISRFHARIQTRLFCCQ